LSIVISGIGVNYVTNPFGGLVYLDRIVMPVLNVGGIPYKLTLFADVFALVWLLGMSYTTKFLDGLDGLAVGVTAIGALIIAAVSLMKEVSQPDTAVIAFALSGACLGFLIFNWHPAKIFLGEGGSTLCGFMLGLLAIVSGGKIATALLVLGLPIFDAVLVIIGRLAHGKTPFAGDRTHLHFRLLDAGFTQRQTVLLYYFCAAFFGISTLMLRGWEKIVALGLSASLLAMAAAVSLWMMRRQSGKMSQS
jgi:UDP-GlcNAc:undecaprenyl-phosphate GlcNAc-1-phosphate transferase